GVETAINQESIFRQLQDDHEDLQHAHTASIHHLGDLHRHLDHLRSQAKPFTMFCQDRYDTLTDELANSNVQLVESRSAVEELEEKLDRVSKLRDNYSELQATSMSTILCLEDEIDTLKRQVQNLQAQFRADCHEAQSEQDQAVAKTNSTSERLDKARAELRARGNHVDSMRANIFRLEQQVADLQTARSQVDHQFVSQKRELAALRVEHAALSAHYKDAYSRFWAVARFLNQDVALPTPASLTRPRSESESSPTRSHKTRRLDLSSSNPTDDLPDPEDQDPEVPEPEFQDLTQESEIEQEGGSPEDDADNPEMLAALAKSRSDLRRSKTSDGDLGASGTAGHPIDLGGEGSDTIPSDGLPEQSPDIDPPADSPDSIHDDDDLASGASKSLPDIQQSSEDTTLTPPYPKVPRSEWIPSLITRRLFRSADVFPWDADRVSHLSISTLNTQVLSHLLLGVSEWLFPDVTPSATPSRIEIEYFVTGPAVDALMSLTPPPWASLESAEGPLSFMVDFMPHGFCEKYLEYEEKHLQALWESSHFLPISEVMCVADAALSAYHESRRQRRSRAGAAWKQFLFRHLIPALRQQYCDCDLDILLDPFFLHFPKPRHPKIWYPDVSTASLEDALSVVDLAEPWRLQYRRSSADHPATRIPRLQDKFVNTPSSQSASNTAVL
ncbi:Hypothetical protein PHPALM_6653, partial [Phytophthora palmivora]